MGSSAVKERDYFPAQRRALILELLKDRGAVSIQELAAKINVSAATVRRDLDYLSDHCYIERAHGGAVLASPQRTAFEPDFAIGSQAARQEKAAIGRLAASTLRQGQSVIFDSSSTVLEAAQAVLRRNLVLTAITNDLNIATTLAGGKNIRLLVPGGSLRPGSYTLYGEPGEGFIAGLHADVALLGIHALVNGFLSDASVEIVTIKRQIIEAAQHVVVLADASKFKSPALCNVCGIDRIDEVITDDGAEQAWQDALEEKGVKVSRAGREAA